MQVEVMYCLNYVAQTFMLPLVLLSVSHAQIRRSPIVLDIARCEKTFTPGDSLFGKRSEVSSTFGNEVTCLNLLEFTDYRSYEIQALLYTTNITIGTPPQSLALFINPNVGDIFVMAKSALVNSVTVDGNNTCLISVLYAFFLRLTNADDLELSSSYRETNLSFESVTSEYSNVLSGEFVLESIGIGDATVTDLQLAVIGSANTIYNVLGLGYPNLEVAQNQYPNLLLHLQQSKMIDCMAYSIWMESPLAPTGQLILGEIDRDKFQGEMETLQICSTGSEYQLMTISMAGVRFAYGSNLVAEPFQVTLYLETTGIFLPESATSVIYLSLGFVWNSAIGYATKACNNIDNSTLLEFTFGSTTITASVGDFVIWLNDSDTNLCALEIFAWEQSLVFPIGSSLLRRMYLVFDISNDQISVAQIALNTSTSNIVTIPQVGVTGISQTTLNTNSTNTTSGTNSTSTKPPLHDSLSTGAKAGIGVGVAVIAILCLLGIGCIFWHRKKRRGAARASVMFNHSRPDSQTQWTKAELAGSGVNDLSRPDATTQKRAVGELEATIKHESQELPGDIPQHEIPGSRSVAGFGAGIDRLESPNRSADSKFISSMPRPRRKPVADPINPVEPS